MKAECVTIRGGSKLSGTVKIAGAKNSALPLLFATVLSSKPCTITNVPNLEDIHVALRLLESVGATTEFSNGTVRVDLPKITCREASYSLVKAMRASFWILGPLLARTGEALVALPGGDAIGSRPVDLHLKGLEAFGASVSIRHGVVHAKAPENHAKTLIHHLHGDNSDLTTTGLRGAEIELGFPSVGATHHLLLTASLIPEESVISGAACEPEIVELCHFLEGMGAQIEGAGTSKIRIVGKNRLHGASTQVLGDRIEAATYLAAAAVTQGKVTVQGISPVTIASTLSVLERSGCSIVTDESSITIKCSKQLKPVSFSTAPYPGLATDVQPILMAAMATADGTCNIDETIFEQRYGHVAEYRRCGAKISVSGRRATVEGSSSLTGAPVQGLDIRAAAGLVLLGLAAEGVTVIENCFHLERGYDSLVENLQTLGAQITYTDASVGRELVVGC